MTTHPCAKINIGLNVVSRRSDGYHNLETVFYPIPLYDTLEMTAVEGDETKWRRRIIESGISVNCPEDDNLVIRAYDLLANYYDLPVTEFRLHKGIPSQAGMGGGSSDVGFAIRMMNEQYKLGMSHEEMCHYASRLGADCALFIDPMPYYGTGIGDVLTPCCDKMFSLKGYHLVVVKPNVAVSTREAYSLVTPQAPKLNCLEAVGKPVEEWRNLLTNDFEQSIFAIHPIVCEIKQQLYDLGAVYAQMSGSGSAVFGIFKDAPKQVKDIFKDIYCETLHL